MAYPDVILRKAWAFSRFSLAQTRYIVSLAAFVALIVRDDARVTFAVAGAVANALGNKGLKRLIAQARPAGSPLHDPGMPSSHASSLFFFASYIALELKRIHTPAFGIPCAIALVAVAALAACYRVVAGFHTPAQVAVGAGVGTLAAAAWHGFARPHLERRLAGTGAALAVAGVVGVGVLSVGTREFLGVDKSRRTSAPSPRRR